MALFIASIVAIIALFVATRIGTAVGRRVPALVSYLLVAAAVVAGFYWLFFWRLSINDGVAGGVVIFWVFAKAFGVVCLVAAGALLYGTATRGNISPDA
jgi:hypothetical protein